MKQLAALFACLALPMLSGCAQLAAIEAGAEAGSEAVIQASAEASRKRVELAEWSLCDRIRMEDWLALFTTAEKRSAWAVMCDVDLPKELAGK